MAATILAAGASALATGVVNKALAPDTGPTGLTQQSDAYTSEMAAQARKFGALWESDYKPVEQRLASEALVAGSPEEQERMAQMAGTDVDKSFEGAKQDIMLGATRRGINTNSPAYIAAMAGIQRERAKTTAGAKNRARRTERDLGFNKRLATSQLGRGLVGESQQGLSAAAGQSGTLASGDFYRQQLLQQQARAGLAPFTGAIGEEVGKRAGDWVRKRFSTNKSAPIM